MAKTVLITGASRGIGKEIAKSFGRDGYNVAVCYNKSKEAAYELCRSLSVTCRAVPIKADITSPDEVENLKCEIIKCFGGVDILVNNAGESKISLLTDLDNDTVSRLLDINLKGHLLVTKAFIPCMVNNKRGRIINISSIWGISGASCEAVYSAAKAGLIGFTKALAKELAPSGITVNCVAPGFINTEMNACLDASATACLIENTPVGRVGTAEDIVAAVRFFASENASFVTGQTLTVDGGLIL